jgi:hypothetical protein
MRQHASAYDPHCSYQLFHFDFRPSAAALHPDAVQADAAALTHPDAVQADADALMSWIRFRCGI